MYNPVDHPEYEQPSLPVTDEFLDSKFETLAEREARLNPVYMDYEVYIADQEYLQRIEELIKEHEGDSL